MKVIPIRIADQHWDNDITPVVSVCCITYNHENYIRDAIEGFLMQETTYPVEILIHDDASTDKTAEIIKEYETKYPSLIKPIYQVENQYSKGVKVNPTFNFSRAKGRYIALCEGDDYWTDSLKLQKQVEFLDSNPEYVLSHTNCDFYYEKTKKLIRSVDAEYEINDFKYKEELFRRVGESELRIRTASVVFRSECSSYTDRDKKFGMGDTPLWLTLSQIGKFHYLNEPTTVYRIHNGSASNPKKYTDKLRFKYSGLEMRLFYYKKYNYKLPNELVDKYNEILLKLYLLNQDVTVHSEYLRADVKRYIDLKLSTNSKLLIYLTKYPREMVANFKSILMSFN